MNNLERCQKYGLVYWKDFVNGRRGNPWWLVPTVNMGREYELYGLSKQDRRTGEVEHFEVLFDIEYVRGWIKKHEDIFLLIQQLESSEIIAIPRISAANPKNEVSTLEICRQFEESAKIVTDSKKPRHSLYLKFKEYITCQQQQS